MAPLCAPEPPLFDYTAGLSWGETHHSKQTFPPGFLKKGVVATGGHVTHTLPIIYGLVKTIGLVLMIMSSPSL